MVDIILLEPEHEGNVGAVARAMANFGFTNLVIINPQCDLNNDEYARRAKHSKGKVKLIVRKRIPKYDLLIGTTAKINSGYNLKRSPVLSENLHKKISKKKKTAILFGREGDGLTNEEINSCNIITVINSSKAYSTLNLSHAVAIILYELHKNMKTEKVADNIKLASNEDIKQLNKMVIKAINSQTSSKKDIQKQVWKNIMNKASLAKREATGAMRLMREFSK